MFSVEEKKWETSLFDLLAKIIEIMPISEVKIISFQLKPLLYILFTIKEPDYKILIETLFDIKRDFHQKMTNILNDSVFQIKFVNILHSKIINNYFQTSIFSTKQIIDAYTQIKQELKDQTKVNTFFHNVFYVTKLPNNIKGITHRYLRILINETGLVYNVNTEEKVLNKVTILIIIIDFSLLLVANYSSRNESLFKNV